MENNSFQVFMGIVISLTPALIFAFIITNSRISYCNRDIEDLKKELREIRSEQWKKIDRKDAQDIAEVLRDRIRILERNVAVLEAKKSKD